MKQSIHFTYLTAGEFGICQDGRGLILNVARSCERIKGGLTREEAEQFTREIAAAPETARQRDALLEAAEQGLAAIQSLLQLVTAPTMTKPYVQWVAAQPYSHQHEYRAIGQSASKALHAAIADAKGEGS